MCPRRACGAYPGDTQDQEVARPAGGTIVRWRRCPRSQYASHARAARTSRVSRSPGLGLPVAHVGVVAHHMEGRPAHARIVPRLPAFGDERNVRMEEVGRGGREAPTTPLRKERPDRARTPTLFALRGVCPGAGYGRPSYSSQATMHAKTMVPMPVRTIPMRSPGISGNGPPKRRSYSQMFATATSAATGIATT